MANHEIIEALVAGMSVAPGPVSDTIRKAIELGLMMGVEHPKYAKAVLVQMTYAEELSLEAQMWIMWYPILLDVD
jgi:hypothetical protein